MHTHRNSISRSLTVVVAGLAVALIWGCATLQRKPSPPISKGPYLQVPGSDTMTVMWESTTNHPGAVYFGCEARLDQCLGRITRRRLSGVSPFRRTNVVARLANGVMANTILSVPGNHEEDLKNYLSYFPMLGTNRWYSFNAGPVLRWRRPAGVDSSMEGRIRPQSRNSTTDITTRAGVNILTCRPFHTQLKTVRTKLAFHRRSILPAACAKRSLLCGRHLFTRGAAGILGERNLLAQLGE